MRYTKTDVLTKVALINKRYNQNYQVNFHSGYGGWNMYIVDKEHGCRHLRGKFGFDCRKQQESSCNTYKESLMRVAEYY